MEGFYDKDPLQEKVDIAYGNISVYMGTVKKTMCDMVPKAITLFIIRSLEKFIKTDLLVKMYGTMDDKMVSIIWMNCEICVYFIELNCCLQLNLFGANEDEAKKYEENKIMYETCAKALDVMEKNNAQV